MLVDTSVARNQSEPVRAFAGSRNLRIGVGIAQRNAVIRVGRRIGHGLRAVGSHLIVPHIRLQRHVIAHPHPLFQRQQVVHVCVSLRREVVGIRHLRAARPSAFGRDDDHAVGCTRTIDGRCRGVFQHFYRLDVVWVEEVKDTLRARTHLFVAAVGLVELGNGEAVDDVQGVVTRIDTARTAHEDIDAAAGLRTILAHVEAGRLTAQRLCH